MENKSKLRKGLAGILAAGMINSYSPSVMAEDILEIDREHTRLEQILKFSAGVATQYGLHEVGHHISARASGTDITFNGYNGNWSFSNNPSDNQKLGTYLGGFGLPMIASEIALRSERFSKESPYMQGFISGPLLNNLIYVIRDSTGNISKEHNDLEGMENAGLSRNITYPLLLGIPIWQTWRAWKSSRNNQIKNYKEAHWNLVIIPLEEKGFSINVSKRF